MTFDILLFKQALPFCSVKGVLPCRKWPPSICSYDKMFITSSTAFRFEWCKAGVASHSDVHLSGNVATCRVHMDRLFFFLLYFPTNFYTYECLYATSASRHCQKCLSSLSVWSKCKVAQPKWCTSKNTDCMANLPERTLPVWINPALGNTWRWQIWHEQWFSQPRCSPRLLSCSKVISFLWSDSSAS